MSLAGRPDQEPATEVGEWLDPGTDRLADGPQPAGDGDPAGPTGSGGDPPIGPGDGEPGDGGSGGGDGAGSGEVWIERLRTGVRGVGQAFITLGVVILLFVAYELWITGLFTQHKQGQLKTRLAQEWNSGEDPTVAEPGAKAREIPLGQGIALIRIPALGLDYARAVVEGTGEAALAEGPGHYVSTAMPGQIGNFSVAGHRVGKGSPFLDLDRLRAGDSIVVETRQYYYLYRVLGDQRTGNPGTPGPAGVPGLEIVRPTDVGVIAPVPNHPGITPDRRLLTLTTCHPKFSAEQRLIIHAELQGVPWPKSKGLPPALTG
ncbi:MAG: class E sortase [Actinobacteria bacterium]|nr:class E sortase [Actinomycetota bacterium]MBI3686248.1 class E sortase [Actinomycetota bacterium]